MKKISHTQRIPVAAAGIALSLLCLGLAARAQNAATNNAPAAGQAAADSNVVNQANAKIRLANDAIRRANEEVGKLNHRVQELEAKVTSLTAELESYRQLGGAWLQFVPDNLGTYPPPPYPIAAMKKHLSGGVSMRIVVSTNGLPFEVAVGRSSGVTMLDTNAVQWVKNRWRWPEGPVRHYVWTCHYGLQ